MVQELGLGPNFPGSDCLGVKGIWAWRDHIVSAAFKSGVIGDVSEQVLRKVMVE
jgi:hypothetical protein